MSKVDDLVTRFVQDITSGNIAAGERMPSIRNAARDYAVSKNTIVETYDRLLAKGLITARQGFGFTVVTPSQTIREDNAPRHIVEAVDSISLLRAQLDQNYAVRIGDGRPPASWMSVEKASISSCGSGVSRGLRRIDALQSQHITIAIAGQPPAKSEAGLPGQAHGPVNGRIGQRQKHRRSGLGHRHRCGLDRVRDKG